MICGKTFFNLLHIIFDMILYNKHATGRKSLTEFWQIDLGNKVNVMASSPEEIFYSRADV